MGTKTVLILMARGRMAERLESAMLKNDFHVISTADLQEALIQLDQRKPEALVVDWDYVNGSMAEIARMVRERCQKTGFILLSKNRKSDERISAMEEGADDCVSQQQIPEELVARVKALIRRIDLVDHSPKTLTVKDIEIDLSNHEVRKGAELIDLTYTQFKILYLLASQREIVFTRDEILHKVWGEHAYVTDRTVDVHVKRLREKLGENGNGLNYIQTIHGLGYRFA